LVEQRSLSEDDLVARARAAGPFRAAYLSTAPGSALRGVIAFVVPDPDRQVTRVALHLAFADAAGVHRVALTWE
jgi:hypothetical protein